MELAKLYNNSGLMPLPSRGLKLEFIHYLSKKTLAHPSYAPIKHKFP
jgi:hypothetical protein